MDELVEAEAERANQALTSESTTTCLLGKDELNLIEYPLGPIKPTDSKTYEIEHITRDRVTKKPTLRKLTIIGSDAFGLPTPTDERVLLGLKALTLESSFASRKVFFSRYHLCQTIGWNPDGRSYKRIEESLDRIAGTTFKFKNAWWDRQENAWRSHTFHLIDNVELCSADRYHQKQAAEGRRNQALCYFVWNDVLWKSFTDGYMRTLDMQMIRRIGNGRRREVPLRLYRWLSKQFYRRKIVRMNVRQLGEGTLGLAAKYPSEFRRVIQRASDVLIKCKALSVVRFANGKNHGGLDVIFEKSRPVRQSVRKKTSHPQEVGENRKLILWMLSRDQADLMKSEKTAIESGFGKQFERDYIRRSLGRPFKESDVLRIRYVQRFLNAKSQAA